MNEPRVDLHVHSTVSDGVLTPSQLVNLAARAGIEDFSLCDHDTTAGTWEALREGEKLGVRVIPGIEIGSGKNGLTHILGYGVLPGARAAEALAQRIRESRFERFYRMAQQVTSLGMFVDAAEALGALPANCSPGRPHIARELARRGYVGSVKEAFEKYLSPGLPGYVERWEPSPEEAMAAIAEGGGLPALAHPSCENGLPMLLQWIDYLRAHGLRCVECRHPRLSGDEQRALTSHCDRTGLLVTGGSDFHDPAQGHQLGYTGEFWPDARERSRALREAIKTTACDDQVR